MRLSQLVGERFKEAPAESVIPSHIFMVRGGYVKYVANGIYSQLTPLKRICSKIETIIREEMDAIDAQEVLFPVALPASLWEESGRYESVGKELLRFTDRNGSPMVLGMTHEEAAVQLVREYGQSHQRYPFAIYQIQTKFRDEARPRGGLIRVREFTMKDAYSFHTSQEDLETHYWRYHKAYENIYRRAGLPVVSVQSDTGMMGGSLSHEFMYLTPVGEDTVVLCSNCDYKSNMEAARTVVKNLFEEEEPLTLVHTPNVSTIEALSGFLQVPADHLCKAVVYQGAVSQREIVVFIRGDMEVNETKVQNLIKEKAHPITLDENSDLVGGFIGPVNLKSKALVLFDRSLEGANWLACGANQIDYHYKGFSIKRDVGIVSYHDLAKVQPGGYCPSCGQEALTLQRGIEVGNIFQLGDKYTKAMNMEYLDEQGKSTHPVMGCYGIGVGRLAASVLEAHHDSHGPIWPMSIAPWQVHLCCMRRDNQTVREKADELYETLRQKGIEVLYDDREVSPGVMFSDGDLLGVPLRVVVSPRNLKEGMIEVSLRDKSMKEMVPVEEAVYQIEQRIKALDSVDNSQAKIASQITKQRM